MPTPIPTRPSATLAALLLVLLGPGCALLVPPEPAGDEPEPTDQAPEEIVAECLALEYDASAHETTRARVRDFGGVRFVYKPSDVLGRAVAAKKPERVFVITHGWMNDTRSARDFVSQLVRGLVDQAEAAGLDPARVAFVSLHWDSERVNFYGSAANAEKIGRRRVARMLGPDLPRDRTVLVGHSLGARLVLSALQGKDGASSRVAAAAVLLEGAVDAGALHPDLDPEEFGAFPRAVPRAGLVLNVHSRRDMVLEHTYSAAMQSPALGFAGASREPGAAYATYAVERGGLAPSELEAALDRPDAQVPGAEGRFVNVDATAVVSGHSDIFIEPVFELLWLAADRTIPRSAADGAPGAR